MRNLALAAVMLGSATGGGLYLYLDAHDVFRPVDLSILEGRGGISVIFDTSASRLLESCSKNCSTPISLEEMGGFPKFAVAAEDKKFWERRGIISKRGTISAVVDWFRGHPIRGASTIQMQVARTLFATEEVARQREEGGTKNLFLRKAREWWVARNLNKTLSREKILELYLNTIHCGDNRDGIEEAMVFRRKRQRAFYLPSRGFDHGPRRKDRPRCRHRGIVAESRRTSLENAGGIPCPARKSARPV